MKDEEIQTNRDLIKSRDDTTEVLPFLCNILFLSHSRCLFNKFLFPDETQFQ